MMKTLIFFSLHLSYLFVFFISTHNRQNKNHVHTRQTRVLSIEIRLTLCDYCASPVSPADLENRIPLRKLWTQCQMSSVRVCVCVMCMYMFTERPFMNLRVTRTFRELAGSVLVMQQSVSRWHCGVVSQCCWLCYVGLCFVCSACSQGMTAVDANTLPFLPCWQCTYSNAHKETGPDTTQIIQRSSCLRVYDAGSASKLLQLRGAQAERQTGRRATHAYMHRRRAESRLGTELAYTRRHTPRETWAQPHTHSWNSHLMHTPTEAHVLCMHASVHTDRHTQQWCIDFPQFFDEMSYSDSLPRCYFA